MEVVPCVIALRDDEMVGRPPGYPECCDDGRHMGWIAGYVRDSDDGRMHG